MASWVHIRMNPGAALLYSFHRRARGFCKLEIAVPAGDSASGIKEATLLMGITAQFRKKEKDRLMNDVSEKNWGQRVTEIRSTT